MKFKQDFILAIPSRGRSAKIAKQLELRHFSQFYIHVFVRKSEYDIYLQALQKYVEQGTLTIKTVPDDFQIKQKRQAIMDYASEQRFLTGVKKLVIMDDDITIDKRRTDDKEKFIKATAEDTVEFFSLMSSCCQPNTPFVGVQRRQGGFQFPARYYKYGNMIRLIMVRIQSYADHNIRTDSIPTETMSDRWLYLQFILRGWKSVMINQYVVDDQGTNVKGGCSLWRNVEHQNSAAIFFYNRFKEYGWIKLRTKTSGEWAEKRLDITIKWSHFLATGERPYYTAKEMEEYNLPH